MAGNRQVFHKAMNEGHNAAWDQNWEQALKAYQEALNEFPDNPSASSSYALAQYQLQFFDNALKAYIHSAKVSPEDPIAFEKIAIIFQKLGKPKEAIQAALFAAELYLKQKDVDKALENWQIVVELDPENLQARSRMALIREKIGQVQLAAKDYVLLAGNLQNRGNSEKALEVITRARELDPANPDLLQAIKIIYSGQKFPKPTLPKEGMEPHRTAVTKELPSKIKIKESPDPISEARQLALEFFAKILFEMADDQGAEQGKPDIKFRGFSRSSPGFEPDFQKIQLHLTNLLDAQTKQNYLLSISEMEKAIKSGFNHPAGFFDLGLNQSNASHNEEALKNLKQSVYDQDFALATRILNGKILQRMNQNKQAAIEYLAALKIADVSVSEKNETEKILQTYEPMTTLLSREDDPRVQANLCENVNGILNQKNWRQNLQRIKDELVNSEYQATSFSELILQPQFNRVMESIKYINELVGKKYFWSAMDESFQALLYAPNYLPLHIFISDLLVKEKNFPDAVTKLMVVANTYIARGETAQAIKILRHVIELSPMDFPPRNRLIEQLLAQGNNDEAVSEYIELADIHYQQTDLEAARKVLTDAFGASQQNSTNRDLGVQILGRIADIDLQRLDWRQAIKVYEQVLDLSPEDMSARENLVKLNLKLNQVDQAQVELESWVNAPGKNKREEIISFLKKLVTEFPREEMLQRILADQVNQRSR